jgi:hypothetical protein
MTTLSSEQPSLTATPGHQQHAAIVLTECNLTGAEDDDSQGRWEEVLKGILSTVRLFYLCSVDL